MDRSKQGTAGVRGGLDTEGRYLLDRAILGILGGSTEDAYVAIGELTEHWRDWALEALSDTIFDIANALPRKLCGSKSFALVAELAAEKLRDRTGLEVEERLFHAVLALMHDLESPDVEFVQRQVLPVAVMLEVALLLLATPKDPEGEWQGVAAAVIGAEVDC